MAQRMKSLTELEQPSWLDFLARYGKRALPPGVGVGIEGIKGLGETIEEAKRQSHSAALGGGYNPKSVLSLALLGPGMSAPSALANRGTMDPNLLATLYLSKRSNPGTKGDMWNIINEKGDKMGTLRTSTDVPGNVHVEGVGASLGLKPGTTSQKALDANPMSHSLGFRDVKSLFMGIKDAYPEAKTVSGFRISGAREAAGSADTMTNRFATEGGRAPTMNTRVPLPFTEKQLETYRAGRPPKETYEMPFSENPHYQQPTLPPREPPIPGTIGERVQADLESRVLDREPARQSTRDMIRQASEQHAQRVGAMSPEEYQTYIESVRQRYLRPEYQRPTPQAQQVERMQLERDRIYGPRRESAETLRAQNEAEQQALIQRIISGER